MQAENDPIQAAALVACNANKTSDSGSLVPVAIPENLMNSQNIKADLQAYDIPAMLESEITEMDSELLAGVPVLVPECSFEQASEIVSSIEMSSFDDENNDFDFDDDDDDFEDDDDEDDEDEDIWDEDDEEEFEDEEDDETDDDDDEDDDDDDFDDEDIV